LVTDNGARLTDIFFFFFFVNLFLQEDYRLYT